MQSNGNAGTLAVLDRSMDLHFIQKNIRDLSKTAQFSHMSELEELHNMAYVNLKSQMVAGKPLAEDPSLALETYRTLSSVVMQMVETKRKAADTLIKARVLIDLPPKEESLLDDEDLPPDEINEASVGDSGVYGKIAKQSEQPDVSMAS